MKNKICIIILITVLNLSVFSSPLKKKKNYDLYRQAIVKTAAMVSNRSSQALAKKYNLQILNVTWEDTGRYKGSSVGPNISDMTIQVQQMDSETKKYQLFCMPVIRFPNFSDKSADIKPEKFFLLVGNEKGKKLKKVNLKKFLKNIRKYLSKPGSWKGKNKSLYAKRDSHVLVSAQACFLPVPKKGIAEFNPVIFNYQSYKGDPAVLTILATREGTSVTIIDNKRDAFEAGATWGQRLFFNQNSERSSFTGKRLSDFKAENKNRSKLNPSVKLSDDKGLNMVLLIQIPLKQKRPMMKKYCGNTMYKSGDKPIRCSSRKSGVEEAVIGHGKVEGPFTEIDDLEIVRDKRFPVRVTVQFYKATAYGVVSKNDMNEISEQINKVYNKADYVGSLVTGGETGRPTEYYGSKFEPPYWWHHFWKRHKKNTGLTPEQTIIMLRELYGPNWNPKSQREFKKKLRILERKKKK